MTDFQFFNVFVFWTRSIVLILSITVVILSLTIYNSNSTPMLNLLEYEADASIGLGDDFIVNDTVRDRRLIATLVAAQASIFCPLFLLMSSSALKFRPEYFDCVSTLEIWRVGIEQLCQFLMPLGLVFSWIFCITFDRKVETAMNLEDMLHSTDTWCGLGASIAENLKYFIIIVLMMEMLGIWIFSFKCMAYMFIFRNQYSIRLNDDLESVNNSSIMPLPYSEKEGHILEI